MAARAYWKGYLRLSLVTIGTEVYAAVARSQKLSFHQIHEPSGKRIRYQKIVPGIGPVDPDDIALRPCGSGLLLETLRYADEIRDSDSIFDAIPDADIDNEMLALAGELIERKSATFDPSDFRSKYSEAKHREPACDEADG